MLGTVCFRLSNRNTHSSGTLISHLHHRESNTYPSQTICRHALSCRTISWSRYQTIEAYNPFQKGLSTLNGSVECGSELWYTSFWHGVLPSQHPSVSDVSQVMDLAPTRENFVDGALHSPFCRIKRSLSFPHDNCGRITRLTMAASLYDGSWNVAWDARPARWLHGRHFTWLRIGVCTCFSQAAPLPTPIESGEIITGMVRGNLGFGKVPRSSTLPAKQVYTDYSITGIAGDGRCLFRAIVHGACIRDGKLIPDENTQRELADSLRSKVVDELVKRRKETEWFIEEDFDTYANRMREHYIWGGEPELLMASHVLKLPITVHMHEGTLKGLISIADYGVEYGTENPIRVLYHGFGHYDAVQIPSSGAFAKL